jgi:hypothetical protein
VEKKQDQLPILAKLARVYLAVSSQKLDADWIQLKLEG